MPVALVSKLSRRTLPFVLLIPLVAGCDQAPGVEPSVGDAPVLSDFSFDPQTVILGGSADEVNGAVRFPLSMRVTARDADADLETVSFVVQSPVSGRDPIASGELVPTTGNRYERTSEISIPKAEVGVYTVLVYAVDRSGSISNNVRGMLRFNGTGEPPVILDVAAPDTVIRPVGGEPAKLIRIVATVTDPDGLANLNEVHFWNVTSPNVKIPMHDDGQEDISGDEIPGDGRYTIIVQIASTNQPGTNRLGFQATDLAGLKSDVVEKAIVVQ